MSATGRNLEGHERRADDFYETPAWVTRSIVRWVMNDYSGGGLWLEPSAGSGAIVRSVDEYHAKREKFVGEPQVALPSWVCVEKRPEAAPGLGAIPTVGDVFTADFLEWSDPRAEERGRFDVAIMNPPYALAEPFVRKCQEIAKVTCALLRLNFLGSQKRADWLREWTPDVFVLPKRPSFTGNGTDATEYAWFVWDQKDRCETDCNGTGFATVRILHVEAP